MRRQPSGFTLIELLVVVAIVGVLAALMTPNAISAMQKAKVRSTQRDITAISTALADYVANKGAPPANSGAISEATRTALSPMALQTLPQNDQWGNAFQIFTGSAVDGNYGLSGATADDFLVVSFGRTGARESFTFNPAAPEGGLYEIQSVEDFQNDLISFNGTFIRAPRAGASGS